MSAFLPNKALTMDFATMRSKLGHSLGLPSAASSTASTTRRDLSRESTDAVKNDDAQKLEIPRQEKLLKHMGIVHHNFNLNNSSPSARIFEREHTHPYRGGFEQHPKTWQ
ncbi:hypothetical protein M413DRAFT_29359 [Hebeloma cylindrosporum]|uniref:Uncharacterized protein n=1 Tax=Hebeloma cylindrosporum TaxID=76867 RepID=A0A0C3C7Y7_HEBCY|nr:hypothetical protein M413DRAFT_29359 [Hebeloma cylindrosporum h7]